MKHTKTQTSESFLLSAVGAGVGGVLSNLFGIKAIWISPILLLTVIIMMEKESR